MTQGLVERLTGELGYADVSLVNHDEFVATPV